MGSQVSRLQSAVNDETDFDSFSIRSLQRLHDKVETSRQRDTSSSSIGPPMAGAWPSETIFDSVVESQAAQDSTTAKSTPLRSPYDFSSDAGTKPRESDTIDIRKIAKLDPPPNVQEIHSILLELTQFLIDESREDDLQDFIDFTEPLPQAPRLPAQVPTSPRITSGDVCEEPEEISGVEQQTADEETSAWPEIPSVSDCSTNEQDSVCSRIQTDVSLSADLSSSFNLPARPIEPRLVDVASRRFEEEHFRRLIMAGATVAGVRGDTSGYSLPSEAPIDTDEDAYWCAIRKLICLTPSSQQPAASADLTVEEFEALEQAYREGFNPLNLDLESEPVLYDPRFLYDNSELSRALEAAQADGSPTSMPFRSPGANTDISGPSDYSTEGASNSPCPDVCWYREVFYLREGVEKINLGRRYGSRGR